MADELKQPLYHSSAFPWDVVEQSGAIHAGSHDQAADMVHTSLGKRTPSAVGIRKGGTGGGDYHADDYSLRMIQPPDSVPNGGMNELNFQPGVAFHDVHLSDREANTAHLEHSREADYGRGGSIDQSAVNLKDTTPFRDEFQSERPDHPNTTFRDPVHERINPAIQALRDNKVLRYTNSIEGNGGTSYIVPNPDLNLRQFGAEPTPVAGKTYHQTPLPGIDLAAVKNKGPMDTAFEQHPEDPHISTLTFPPDFSRTRRGREPKPLATRPVVAPDHPRLF
jgi:hypothetical protein